MDKLKNRIHSVLTVIRCRYSLQEVPRRGIHNVIAAAMSICVAFGNKVMDTRLPQPAGCGDKHDVESRGQYGRSMIEMLGVLAIIAVLSVGGIAGYSKAMQMYQQNKWFQQIEDLIFSIRDTYKNERKFGDTGDILPTLKQIGIVPQDMLDYKNNDLFGNTVKLYMFGWKDYNRMILQFDMLPSSSAPSNCSKIFQLLPTYTNSIWAVVGCQGLNCADKMNWFHKICGKIVPKDYVSTCPTMEYNFNDIVKGCQVCKNDFCTFQILFDNNV